LGFPMPTSNRLAFPHSPTSESVTSRTAVYGPVRTVVFLWAVWPTNRNENLCTMNPGARRQGSLSHWMS
jgi:hypothetical protein